MALNPRDLYETGDVGFAAFVDRIVERASEMMKEANAR